MSRRSYCGAAILNATSPDRGVGISCESGATRRKQLSAGFVRRSERFPYSQRRYCTAIVTGALIWAAEVIVTVTASP
jgi:hypothetical protein